MFIDYALLVFGSLVLLAYAIANILVVINYSLKFMRKEFWVSQKWCGKICANVFYLPAWIINFALAIIVCVVYWVLIPIYKLLKGLVKWLHPLYEKAIRFDM